MSLTPATSVPAPIPGWDGFHIPNYTPVPDDFFDVLLAHLTDVEVRVLLYIMRRTFGFKKASDAISLSQITDGIVTHAGERLDYGAGVSKNGAVLALARLQARGIVQAQRRRAADGGHAPTVYSLRMRGVPPLSPPGTPPLHPLSPVGTTPAAPLSPGETRGGPPVGQALVPGGATQETVVQETVVQEDDSNHALAQEKIIPPVGTAYSPLIAAEVLELARAWGDQAGTAQVQTALSLWTSSGLDEAAFVDALWAATQQVPRGRQKPGQLATVLAGLRLQLAR